MPSSWRKLIPENRKFVVGYIGDMKQHMGINDHFWTREALKYLVKYVLLKHIDNNFISYYFSNENTQVVDHVYAYTIVDGVDVFSGSEEEQQEEQDQDQHDYAIEGADDNDDENYPKGESSSANMVGTTAPSSRSYIFHLIYVQKYIPENFKIERQEKNGAKVTEVSNHVGNIEQEYEVGTDLLNQITSFITRDNQNEKKVKVLNYVSLDKPDHQRRIVPAPDENIISVFMC